MNSNWMVFIHSFYHSFSGIQVSSTDLQWLPTNVRVYTTPLSLIKPAGFYERKAQFHYHSRIDKLSRLNQEMQNIEVIQSFYQTLNLKTI